MTNNYFSILATLSSTAMQHESNAEKKCIELRAQLEDKLLPLIYKSKYIEKSRMELAFGRILDEAVSLSVHPELLGRSCIAIICADNTASNVIKNLTASDGDLEEYGGIASFLTNFCSDDMPVPIRLCPSSGKPYVSVCGLDGREVLLDGEARTSLLPQEFYSLMHLPGINPREVISSLSCFVPLKRKYSTYIIASPEEFYREECLKIFAHCDAFIVIGKLKNTNCLNVLQQSFHIPVYFTANNTSHKSILESVQNIKKTFTGRISEIISTQEIQDLLDSYNKKINRITFHDRIMSEILSFVEFIKIQINDNKNLLSLIKKDNVLSCKTNINIDDVLESKQKELTAKNSELNKIQKDFSKIYEKTLEIAEQLDSIFVDMSPKFAIDSNIISLHTGSTRPVSVWRRIVLRLLMSGNLAQAEKYQEKFEKYFPDQAFITNLYIKDYQNSRSLSSERGKYLSHSDLERLRWMPDSPEVLRAKIYFRNALGLELHDCAEIAALLRNHKDADEKYFWAEHLNEVYQQNKEGNANTAVDFDQVVNAFLKASLAGSEEAAQTLALYCSKENRSEDVQKLADMAIPAAAYIFQLICRIHRDNLLATRYLKMAAALGHQRALLSFAEEIWSNRICKGISFDYNKRALYGLKQEIIDAGISLYDYLKNNFSHDNDKLNINERLGYFYFCNRQWSKSRELLDIYPRPASVEGKFCLSIMLKYGHGGRTNKDEAIKLIREAESMSGFFAHAAEIIKRRWYMEDRANI